MIIYFVIFSISYISGADPTRSKGFSVTAVTRDEDNKAEGVMKFIKNKI